MTSRPRLLIIGFDDATPALVQRWVEGDHPPVLAKLVRQGTWAPLRSVPNAWSPAVWTTFMTGMNLRRHGICDFIERIPESHSSRPVNGSMRDGVPFWHLLSRDGFRVGVMNVPMTYPAEALNGFMLAGMDAPAVDASGFAYPLHCRGSCDEHPPCPRGLSAGGSRRREWFHRHPRTHGAAR